MSGQSGRFDQLVAVALSALILVSAVTGGVTVLSDEASATHNDSRIRDIQLQNSVDQDGDGYKSSFDVQVDAEAALHDWDPYSWDTTGEPRFVVEINGQQVYANTFADRLRYYTLDLSDVDWSQFDRDSAMRVKVTFYDDDPSGDDPVDSESTWIDFEPPNQDQQGDLDVSVEQDGVDADYANVHLWDGGGGSYSGTELVESTGWDGTAEFSSLEPSDYQVEIYGDDGDFWGAPTYSVDGGQTNSVTFDRRAPHVTGTSVSDASFDGDGILEPDDTVTISADVRNDESYAKDVEVTFDVDGQTTRTIETTVSGNSETTISRDYYFGSAGTYDYSVSVDSDYGSWVQTDHTDQQSFTLEAGPSIDREGAQDVSVERGESITFEVLATDPSNNLDGVQWSLDGTPDHTSSAYGGSDVESWTKTFTSTGTYTVTASAYDEGYQYSDEAEWTVEVTEATGTIEATVVEDGTQLSDATVYLFAEDTRSKTTGSDGSVTFTDVPLGEFNLAYHADGEHRGGASVTVDGGTTQVELSRVAPLVTDVAIDDDKGDGDGTPEIGEPVTVSPTVFNDEAAQHPVRTLISVRGPNEAIVENPNAVPLDGVERGPKDVGSDSYGYFGVDAVAQTPGTYEVKVVTETDYGNGWVKTDETAWQTAFTADSATLAGTVTAEGSGDAIGGATIILDGEQVATTNDDGSYSVRVDSLGDHTLQVDASGFESTSRTVTVASESATENVELLGEPVDVYFEVSKKSSIDGYSIDGEPVEGATVSVAGTDYVTDAEGQVHAELRPGTYQFTVNADGYESNTGEVSINPGESSSHVVGVPLLRDDVGVVATEVLDENGDALGGNTYRVLVDGEQVDLNSKGEFLVEAGTHVVRVEPTDFGESEGLVPVEREVSVGVGERTTQTFRPTSDALTVESSRETTVTGSPISLRATFSGASSVESYKWTVVEVPDGDDGVPATPENVGQRITSFRPEAPGEYVLAVTATTTDGQERTKFQTITVEERSSLVDKYAPIIHFHEDETYFPTRYEAYVRNANLTDGSRTVENPSLWDLADASADSHLSLRGEESKYSSYDDPYPKTVHASVNPEVTFRGEQYTAVTYWLFYVYDPKAGFVENFFTAHESDTETVTVLAQDGEAKWVGASQHKGGEQREWSKMDATGTHPHVYPAKGAHSNYLRDTSQYSGQGLLIQEQFLWSDVTDTENAVPASLADQTGGGEVWSPDGSVGDDYEIAVLTGDEPWQSFEGTLTESDGGTVPKQRTRWTATGEWLTGIPSDEAQIEADLKSYEVTDDREVTAGIANTWVKPHTFHLTTQSKPADASWQSDAVYTTTTEVRVGSLVGTITGKDVSVEAVPDTATGDWDVRTTVRAYEPTVAEAEDDFGTRTATLTDLEDVSDETDLELSLDTNVTGKNLDESTPTSPYLAVEAEVTGANENFDAENLSLTYSRPGDWLDSSAEFRRTGDGEYVAYVPFELGNVTYTVTAEDDGDSYSETRERLLRPVVFSNEDYFGVYYGSEPVTESTLEKIEKKGVELALKKSGKVAIGGLLTKLGIAGGKTISKKVFALATFLGKMIPQNGYGFSSSYADVYLATNASGADPSFDSVKTVSEGEEVYPIFDAYADLKDPLWLDHSLSARFVSQRDGEVAERYETELVHPYGQGEYVVIPREPITAPEGLDADETREYAVDPEYRVGDGENATLYVTGDDSTQNDTTAPTVESVVPEAGSVVAPDVSVNVAYADDGSGVDPATVTISVDGRTLATDATETQATASLADGDLSGGTHTLTVTVADEAGNEQTHETDFTVDATAPAADLDLNGTTVSPTSPVEIDATVTDQSLQPTSLRVVNASTGEVVATWSLSAGKNRIVWTGVAEDTGLLLGGEYELRVDATDAIGRTTTESRSVFVESEPPTVSLGTVSGTDGSASADAGEVVTANDTVTVSGSVTPGSSPVETVTVGLSAAFTNYEHTATATVEDGSWTATIDASALPDDGTYLVSATATGTRGLADTRIALTTVDVDRDDPTVTARVVPAEGALDRVVVTSDESLDDAPTLVVDRPNGGTETVDLTADGPRRWTGTVSMGQPGSYDLTVTGTDETGNADTETITTAVETDFSTGQDGTVRVGGQRSDAFTVLHLAEDERGTLGATDYAALNSLNVSPVDLTAGRQGAGFLAGELSENLSAAITKATLAIPVEESRVPEGQTAESLDVHYYNETTDQWERLDTTVQTRTDPGSEGTERRYWVANVTHFSIYGVVATDDAPPSKVSAGPTGTVTGGDQTVTFEYEDDVSGVNASEVSIRIDGESVTDEEGTAITSDGATYEASGLDAGDHTATVTAIDEAGNEATFSTTFTVEATEPDDSTPPTATFETPSNGATLDAGTEQARLVANYEDSESGVATENVTLQLDGQDVTASATVTADGVEYDATDLGAGTHTISLRVGDDAGNFETAAVEFTIPEEDDGDDSGGGGDDIDPPEPSVQTELTELAPSSFTAKVTSARADAPGQVSVDGGISAGDLSVRGVSLTPTDTEATSRFFVSASVTESAPIDADAPADGALGYLDLSTTYISDAELGSVGVQFAVPADAVSAPENVALYRYDGASWQQVETTLDAESGGEYVLRASATVTGTFAVGVTAGDLSVTDVAVKANQVAPGETVSVTATVENTGSGTASDTVELEVDGEVVDETEVTVAGGESTTVTFEMALDDPGQHDVAVGGADAGTVTVGDATDSATDRDSDETADQGTDDGATGGVPGFGVSTALVALLALFGSLMVARRRD
jgi:hypothetical protein